MTGLVVDRRGTALRFAVRVQPRAARNEVAGVHDAALKVRLNAPPVDGAANEALVKFLARAIGVASRQVRIVSGTTSRLKTIEVEGIDAKHLDRLTTLADDR